jgi:hypothetical protein
MVGEMGRQNVEMEVCSSKGMKKCSSSRKLDLELHTMHRTRPQEA